MEVVARREVPGRDATFGSYPDDVPASLRAALEASGRGRPYAHQARAWAALDAGRDVLLTTGTASGKSLAYQGPILAAQRRDPATTALALFPTKALAASQADAFAALAEAAGVGGSTVVRYDGDTPPHRRAAARAAARTLITNPDMLHAGVLPHHTLWRAFLTHLAWIVVDEVHVYRGVFGGHLAGVLRRLVRLARAYGAHPQVVATSATLGNPTEHAARVLGRDVVHVAEDAAPKAARDVWVARPPLVDEALGLRRPLLADAARVAGALAEGGRQTLVFAGSRQGVEEMVVPLRARGLDVRAYRSGLLSGERRAIEGALRDGVARVVVATNALELGIDVGGIDAVVVAGYPGATSALWQRLGRAGRRDRPGVGVVLLGTSPLDAYLARDPDRLFADAPERALTDPDHLVLALDHLRCATFERPLEGDEGYGRYGPDDVALLARQMEADGEAHRAEGRTYWIGSAYPAATVSLRSAGRADVHLEDVEGRPVGIVDGPSARWMVHPGATYLHDGAPHEVVTLDLEAGRAVLRPTGDEVVTRAQREREVTPAGPLAVRTVGAAHVVTGEVDVRETVTGYRRVRRTTFETLSRHALDLPPYVLRTRAYAFGPDAATLDRLRAEGAWTADPNAYGSGWPAVRRAVLERDAHRCRTCGGDGAGAALHVHHVTPFRAFASAREANRSENLVTLCPACHARAERSVRVRSGLAGLAYVLRSLAPLRILSDARDLGVIAEGASALLDGLPAVVAYETVPGGVGLADALADDHRALMGAAYAVVRDCPCDDGCPSCVGPPGEAGHAGKAEARALAEALR